MTSAQERLLPGMPGQVDRPQEPESPPRCSACGRPFATVRLFDRHRRRSRCVDPVELGLTFDGSVWR